MDNLAPKIHALLFFEGGTLTYKSLARSLGAGESDIKAALVHLEKMLQGSGLGVVRSDTEASLAVAPEVRDVVIKMIKEDEEHNIGDAGLEIVAILLYEGPSTRAQIDYIRGVNSSSTIRTLLTRGLLERSGNPEDGREYIYRATTELLAHLGAGEREKLPEYGIIAPELAAFKNTHGREQGTNTGAPDA